MKEDAVVDKILATLGGKVTAVASLTNLAVVCSFLHENTPSNMFKSES